MPFIKKERRELIDSGEMPDIIQPGDLCYMYYKPMVEKWREEPRWTTAHEIFKSLFTTNCPDGDHSAARSLAWMVFFQLHVMPYEHEKRKENGDV